MQSIDGAVLDLKRLDLLSTGDSAIHRLDARAKVVTTLCFIIAVISFDRYALTELAPFLFFPVITIALSDLPIIYILKKILTILPFTLFVGLFNPFFDREIHMIFGPVAISGGWISCISILARSALTVGSAVILIASTGFMSVCHALDRLGMPRVFTVQLLFLYRYIFVLTEEAARTARARELRSFGRKGMGINSYGSIIGHLLIRTWSRAERIHMAMLARGFSGEFHSNQIHGFSRNEYLYVIGWSLLFIVLRTQDVTGMLGSILTGFFS
jgi:cobalt/nickel transport system permease protein